MLKQRCVTALGTALVLAGCGNSTVIGTATKSAPTTTATHASARTSTPHKRRKPGLSEAAAGRAYLSIADATNTAITTLQAKFKAAGPSTTPADLGADAQPAEAALAQADGKLATLAHNYRPAASDIRALIRDDAAMAQVLASTASLTSSTVQQWDRSIERDLSRLSSAVSFVRTDLGLPQKS
ncbi:MAG TPA: hypothetical protein VG223_18580 [Solirubrobacteraceae bacterium]|jgi:hypothetical protein|nr:hypothetical protein [Solirubrobacteraceae bacterium]